MCCVWSRQEAECFCLASAVIGHCQPRRWAEKGSAGHAGWGPLPGHERGSKVCRFFMAQKRFQQPKPGKAALDCSRPPGMTLDEL